MKHHKQLCKYLPVLLCLLLLVGNLWAAKPSHLNNQQAKPTVRERNPDPINLVPNTQQLNTIYKKKSFNIHPDNDDEKKEDIKEEDITKFSVRSQQIKLYDQFYTIRNTLKGLTALEYPGSGSVFVQKLVKSLPNQNHTSWQDMVASIGDEIRQDTQKSNYQEVIEVTNNLHKKLFLHPKNKPFYAKDYPKNAQVLQNPLVLITGCADYVDRKNKKLKHLNLPGVKTDMYSLATAFEDKYQYDIWCTYNYEKHKQGKKASGKIKKEHFDTTWNNIKESKEDYDGLVFFFCGHGSENHVYYYGFEPMAIDRLRHNLANHFLDKPKVLVWLACRVQPAKVNTRYNIPQLPHAKDYIDYRHDEVKAIYNNFSNDQEQVIMGVAGIGKSVLARLYAQKYGPDDSRYKYVFWLNVDTKDNLDSSLQILSKNLNIHRNDAANTHQHIASIHSKLGNIYGHLCFSKSTQKILLIFDNANSSHYGRYYAPLYKGIPNIQVLYTCRAGAEAKAWDAYKVVVHSMQPLSISECVCILQEYTQPADEEVFEIDIEHFLKRQKVRRLPVVISQLGHYLKHTKDYKGINKVYEDHKDQFVKNKQKYQQTLQKIDTTMYFENFIDIATSFDLVYTNLYKNPNKQVVRILRVLSYLNAEGLCKVFFDYLPISRKDYWFPALNYDSKAVLSKNPKYKPKVLKAIKILQAYGIILNDGTSTIENHQKLRIHRSIQTIMRVKMSYHGKQSFFSTTYDINTYIQQQAIELLEALIDMAPYDAQQQQHSIIAHAQSLVRFQYDDINKYLHLLSIIGRAQGYDYYSSDLYLPPADAQNTNQQLHTSMCTALENYKSILLTASAGGGKSTYLAYLCQQLWTDLFDQKKQKRK